MVATTLDTTSLFDARTALTPRPGPDTPVATQIAYYERRADMFDHIARNNPRHHYEAAAEAWLARDHIAKLTAR